MAAVAERRCLTYQPRRSSAAGLHLAAARSPDRAGRRGGALTAQTACELTIWSCEQHAYVRAACIRASSMHTYEQHACVRAACMRSGSMHACGQHGQQHGQQHGAGLGLEWCAHACLRMWLCCARTRLLDAGSVSVALCECGATILLRGCGHGTMRAGNLPLCSGGRVCGC
jgi:hypothetical protein